MPNQSRWRDPSTNNRLKKISKIYSFLSNDKLQSLCVEEGGCKKTGQCS